MALPKDIRQKKTKKPGTAAAIKDVSKKVMSCEELLEAAYENRADPNDDLPTIMAHENRSTELVKAAGFDFVDVRTVEFNEKNIYSIDEGSIEALADLIFTSKNTTPVILWRVDGSLRVIDGERRCRAHMLLGEKHGELWYMVPARIYDREMLSDEDAEYILHAENIGQRKLSTVERAKGFKAVKDRILKMRREGNPEAPAGKMANILAVQFGCSLGTVSNMLCIASASEETLAAFENMELTQMAVVQMSHLNDEDQSAVLAAVRGGAITPAAAEDVARIMRDGASTKEAVSKVQRDAEAAALEKELAAERASRTELEKMLEEANTAREREATKLSESLRDAEARIAELNENLSAAKEGNEESDLAASLEQERQEREVLEQQLAALEKAHSEETEDLSKDLSKAEKRIAELTDQLEKAKAGKPTAKPAKKRDPRKKAPAKTKEWYIRKADSYLTEALEAEGEISKGLLRSLQLKFADLGVLAPAEKGDE